MEQQKKEGVKRLYVHLQLEDHNPEVDPWAWGGEPIYRDGVFVGVTTTTGYGFTLNNLVSCVSLSFSYISSNFLCSLSGHLLPQFHWIQQMELRYLSIIIHVYIYQGKEANS